MDIFGVFDGHGGKQAATFASRNLTERLLSILMTKAATESELEDCSALDQLQNSEGVDSELWTAWDKQDKLITQLPGSLVESFHKLQHQFFQQAKVICLSPSSLSPS